SRTGAVCHRCACDREFPSCRQAADQHRSGAARDDRRARRRGMTDSEIEQLGPALLTLAYDAGRAVMAVYATEFERRVKDDHSPVTDADEAAEEIILAGLDRLTPGMPVIAEEMAAAGRLPAIGEGPFWLVDPLDGTREFIARNGEFTVNIALVCEA